MRNPIRAKFTVPYGAAFGAVRAGGARTHQGMDQHAPEGTPIFAGQHGTVIARGYTSGYGNYADIAYPGNIHIRYAHMQYPAALTHRQSWSLGEPQLGLVGLTGSAAYGDPPGAHLHVEVRVFGKLVDPAKFFERPALAGSTGTLIGDTLSAAEVTQINTHITNEINRLAGYVRREARARLFKNSETGEFMIADPKGVFLDTDIAGDGEIDSLKTNGYLLIASEENAQVVDQQRWDNIIAKIEDTRASVSGTGPVSVATVDTSAIVSAVLAGIAEQFRLVNENIDDQPTTFKITPA